MDHSKSRACPYPNNVKDIYQNQRITKSRLYLVGYPSIKNKNTFLALDNDVHRFKTKLVGRVVSDRAVREFEPTMLDQVHVFLAQIESSKPVNMTEQLRYLGVDITSMLIFGYEMRLQTNVKNRFLLQAIDISSWYSNVALQNNILSWVYPMTLMDILTLHVQIPSFFLLNKMVQTREKEGKHARKDLYSFVVDAQDPKKNKPLGHTGVKDEAAFLMQAGGYTTSTCISAAFFYLSHNPKCYEKLVHEIRTTFSSSADIKGGQTLSKCYYLRACIDEALRMSPPAAGTLWRELDPNDTSPEPLIIDGQVIPKGTHLGTNIYALHHNEEYFPNPFIYNPDRWLAPDGTHFTHEAFAAFLTGYRGCAGKTMAYLLASLVLAKTLWSFDFERAPGALGKIGESKVGEQGEVEFQLHDMFTSNTDGPYLVFRPRGGH
ncbi:cytochrome P450 [Xylariomycetidae sp. FL2044]|nr:cytochrome P450 [Xylariomycetidae sp. FL2044]